MPRAPKPAARGSKQAAKPARKTRGPRPSLTPKTVSYHQFEPAHADGITVGYVRKLVAGIPRQVPDTHFVDFGEDHTIVSSQPSGAPALTVAGSDDEDDEDEDDEDEDDD